MLQFTNLPESVYEDSVLQVCISSDIRIERPVPAGFEAMFSQRCKYLKGVL